MSNTTQPGLNSNLVNYKYWIGLGSFLKFGSKRLSSLLNLNPDVEFWYNKAEVNDFVKANIPLNIAEEFLLHKSKINLDNLINKYCENNIEVLTIFDETYPQELKKINNPPIILYYRGQLTVDYFKNQNCIAVVGSRKITYYGKESTVAIVTNLVSRNYIIVSGLALGVDTIAHATAIDQKGLTVAVLGHGLDLVYPEQNKQLVIDILNSGGVLMSEYPVGTQPLRPNFPYRNRIIAGLSKAVVITEAAEDSGSLITAEYARKQNKTVYMVPGNINSSTSKGCNTWIKNGCKIVTSPDDIEPESQSVSKKTSIGESHKNIRHAYLQKNQNPILKQILKCLSKEPRHIDEIIQQTNLPASEVISSLTLLEINSVVVNTGGMCWVLSKPP